MQRSDYARDLAVGRALHYTAELETTTRASDRTKLATLRTQYMKAAAELAKGNIPLYTGQGYLVESRSGFVGKLVEVSFHQSVLKELGAFVLRMAAPIVRLISETGEITNLPADSVTCKFLVTGGDVYLVRPALHRCTCIAGEAGCWHSCLVECYIQAGNHMIFDDEDVPEDWLPPVEELELEAPNG